MDPSPIGTPKILKIGSRKYAVGLRWVVADSANRDLRAQARQEIRDTGGGADLYVLREAQAGRDVSQFGLGSRADGLVPGAVVEVLENSRGTVLVLVEGVRIAIGRGMALRVLVEPLEQS